MAIVLFCMCCKADTVHTLICCHTVRHCPALYMACTVLITSFTELKRTFNGVIRTNALLYGKVAADTLTDTIASKGAIWSDRTLQHMF